MKSTFFRPAPLVLLAAALMASAFIAYTLVRSPFVEAQPSDNADLSNLEMRLSNHTNFGWGVTDRYNRPVPGADFNSAGISRFKFSAGTTSYNTEIPEGYSHLKVRATAADSNATIEIGKGTDLRSTASGTGSHAMSLDRGADNTINVKVTAQDTTTTKTYAITIHRYNRAVMLANGKGVSCCTSGRVNAPVVNEGDSFTLTVKLLAPAAHKMDFRLFFRPDSWWYPFDAEEGDYTAVPKITIAKGESSASVTVQTNPDADKEPDIFRITLGDQLINKVSMWQIEESFEVPIRDATPPDPFTMFTRPNQPRNLRAAAQNDEISLNWEQPAGIVLPFRPLYGLNGYIRYSRTTVYSRIFGFDGYGYETAEERNEITLTGYEVQYKEQSAPDKLSTTLDPSTGWTVAAIHYGLSPSTTIRHQVKPGTTYDVRVRASNRMVAGAWTTAQVTTPSSSQDQNTDRIVHWSGTLTVAEPNHGNAGGCLNHGRSPGSCADQLSDDDFTLNGTDYNVWGLMRIDHHSPWVRKPVRIYDRSLKLILDTNLPTDVDLRLSIAGTELHLSDAKRKHFYGQNWFDWEDPDFYWKIGDRIQVSLVEPRTVIGSGGTQSPLGAVPQPQLQQQAPQNDYSNLIAQMKEWREDPRWRTHKAHTDRWDRALMAFGETVDDQTLTKMTAAEAQAFADKGSAWSRWVEVAKALKEIESSANSDQDQNEDQEPPNQAPTVSNAISDATIVNQLGTHEVSLSGVFDDADGDTLTIGAASSNQSAATVVIDAAQSSLTVTAKSRGTATITVTADDGNGGTVSDAFTVRVKASPTVASAISDITGLEAGSTRDVTLSGVFSDADGDALTITAYSDDSTKASVASDGSSLTVTGVSEGDATITVTAQDSDGNRVFTEFAVAVTAVQQDTQPQGNSEPDNQEPVDTSSSEPDPTATPTTETETSDIVARYDANGDGKISNSELSVALNDYYRARITNSQMLEVLAAR